MELSYWFKGFEKGLARLSDKQRSELLAECSKSCVRQGIFSIYQELYNQANGDLDQFFTQANELPGVRCEIVESESVYHLYFESCTCELCQKGYVSTPLLCECSRQSILYVLSELWRNRYFRVTLCHSILQGAYDCKMQIETEKRITV